MSQRRSILASLIILTLLLGCENESFYDNQRIRKCHGEIDWDVQQIKNELIGLWEWKYVECCGEADPYENNSESKGLMIEFRSDGTAVLIDNDALSEFAWDVSVDNNYFSFSTSQFISQIDGEIVLCNDIMLCSAYGKDGADNYFAKVD